MKVNVISDIHASVDKKLNVIYNLQNKSSEKVKKTVNAFKKYWHDHEADIRAHKIQHSSLALTFDTVTVKTHDDILKIIELYESSIDTEFSNISNDTMYEISRAFHDIDFHFKHNKLEWWKYCHTLTFDELVNYMFKCKYDFDPAKLELADYLIIAGDLGIDPIYDLVLKDIEKKTEGKFKKILHIAGNHDHWWFRVNGLAEEKPDAVNLDHDYCVHVDGDYAFIGCTMWTPVAERDVYNVGRYMNDYRYIPGKFSPYASNHQYEIQSSWLRQQLAKYHGKKCIVFTHHQPFEELTLEDYKHNGKGWDGIDVNAAYVVQDHSLDDIANGNNIVLWACGHTHANYDGMLHGIHVVRNPIGYRDITDFYYSTPENMSGTWYNKVIEL